MVEFILGNFEEFRHPWDLICRKTNNQLLFSSPVWSELWWEHFGIGNELYLGAVKENGSLIGIAPMSVKDGTLYFIGSDNVCDFLDFIIEPGKEELFIQILLRHLKDNGITTIDLFPLLPESAAKRSLADMVRNYDFSVSCTQYDVTVSLNLPGDLTSYLSLLSGKQRHELLRKERRLHEEGEIDYQVIEKASTQEVDMFIRFFRESREDKNQFLTGTMETFFRAIIDQSAENKMLRLGILKLNSTPVAVTLCFDYQNDIYLYNSGYNPDYRWLSVGLLSKYFCIKYCIEHSKHRYDFLKGAEKYKFHLGGKEVPLFRCIIKI